jgi:Hsp20/alpha crystallin family
LNFVCRFRICVDIGSEYSPDELTVKTIDRKLYLLAHHNELGPGNRTTSREMNREFDLPDSVNPETVTASLTEKGELVIEAPLCHTSSPSSPSSPKSFMDSSMATSPMNSMQNDVGGNFHRSSESDLPITLTGSHLSCTDL